MQDINLTKSKSHLWVRLRFLGKDNNIPSEAACYDTISSILAPYFMTENTIYHTTETYTFTLDDKKARGQKVTYASACKRIKEKYGFNNFYILPRSSKDYMTTVPSVLGKAAWNECDSPIHKYLVVVNPKPLSECLDVLTDRQRKLYDKYNELPKKVNMFETLFLPSIKNKLGKYLIKDPLAGIVLQEKEGMCGFNINIQAVINAVFAQTGVLKDLKDLGLKLKPVDNTVIVHTDLNKLSPFTEKAKKGK